MIWVSDDDSARSPERWRHSHPADDDYDVPAVFDELGLVHPRTQWTHPDLDGPCVAGFDWHNARIEASRRTRRQLDAFHDRFPSQEFRVLGWPSPTYGANYIHDTLRRADERFGDLRHDADAWRLLFQVVGWHGGFAWGEQMRLLFMIPDVDLQARWFDRVIACLEAG